MIQEQTLQRSGVRLFSLPSVLYQNTSPKEYRIVKISAVECQMRRHEYERMYYNGNRPEILIRLMAELGRLDGYFSKKAIRKAKNHGVLPEGYQIHHIIPIKLGGSNEIDNLCVIDAQTHVWMHQVIYQELVDKLAPQEEARFVFTQVNPVVTPEDRKCFFLHSEVRKLEREEVLSCEGRMISRHKRAWDNTNADMGRRDVFSRTRGRSY